MTRSARILAAAAFMALGAVAPPSFAQGVNISAPSAPERPATITAIPGVISGNAKWELIWRDTKTADGIVGTPDGGVIFAQEQSDTIRKLDSKNRETVYLRDTHGTGSVSLDTQGRLFAVQRTCTDPGKHMPNCAEPTKVVQLAPKQKVLAEKFANGKALGRLNDLITDGRGGAYFTVGGVYYVNAKGVISTVADKDIRPNGIMLSANGKTLFATNGTGVLAFDINADGTTKNRRDFGALEGDTGADGMAIDSAGHLYVTASKGVHVLGKDGKHLGLIQTPRVPITLAFSGPDKKTLYVPCLGAYGADGKPWNVPEGVRNTAMTIYRIPMVAHGYTGRPK
ncbi:MAG TPA: SMP-30/gluconolactonase/LRE family protein [Steroidobacteraceae bacterium]|nr:SMP-30/gluconolactonase/LRE family protein [Steroidobacteraceae bacterium]